MAAALKKAAKDRLDDQLKVALENTVGSNWADAITHFTAQVTGTDKPSDLVGKAFDSGTVKVTGAGKSSSAQVAIAFNQDDNAKTKMVATVTNTGEPELNVPQGKYIVVATDTAGNKAEKTDVNVTAGQETTVAMQPKSSDDTGGEMKVSPFWILSGYYWMLLWQDLMGITMMMMVLAMEQVMVVAAILLKRAIRMMPEYPETQHLLQPQLQPRQQVVGAAGGKPTMQG